MWAEMGGADMCVCVGGGVQIMKYMTRVGACLRGVSNINGMGPAGPHPMGNQVPPNAYTIAPPLSRRPFKFPHTKAVGVDATPAVPVYPSQCLRALRRSLAPTNAAASPFALFPPHPHPPLPWVLGYCSDPC